MATLEHLPLYDALIQVADNTRNLVGVNLNIDFLKLAMHNRSVSRIRPSLVLVADMGKPLTRVWPPLVKARAPSRKAKPKAKSDGAPKAKPKAKVKAKGKGRAKGAIDDTAHVDGAEAPDDDDASERTDRD